MKIQFLKPWGMSSVGDIIDPPQKDIAILLVTRKVAAWVPEDNDLDGDGKAEGGIAGIKKAFSAPPRRKYTRHKR